MKGLGHGIVVVLVVVLANACVVSDGLPPLPYLHYHSSNYYKTTCDLDVVETKNAFRKAYNYTLRDCFCRIANLRARRNTRLSAGQLLPCSATLLLLLLLVTYVE